MRLQITVMELIVLSLLQVFAQPPQVGWYRTFGNEPTGGSVDNAIGLLDNAGNSYLVYGQVVWQRKWRAPRKCHDRVQNRFRLGGLLLRRVELRRGALVDYISAARHYRGLQRLGG